MADINEVNAGADDQQTNEQRLQARVAELEKQLAAERQKHEELIAGYGTGLSPDEKSSVREKIAAGLTRDQAVQVVLRQRAHDKAEAEAAKKQREAEEAKKAAAKQQPAQEQAPTAPRGTGKQKENDK